MAFTERQRTGIALLVAAAMGVGGLWYGLDYYRDAAGCDAGYRKQNAAVTKVRSDLAAELRASQGAFLAGIGDAILAPEDQRGKERANLRPLAADSKATLARVTAGLEANPLPTRPEGCTDA